MTKLINHLLLLLACMPVILFAQTPSSYDADGDAIPDSTDQCLFTKGSQQFKGCPHAMNVTIDDRDGDGVANIDDACADMFGSRSNNGCPVLDGTAGSNTSSFFTTSSSTVEEDKETFRRHIMAVVGDSAGSQLKSEARKYREQGRYEASVCLVGANECYIYSDTAQYYYANYGTYSTRELALQKFEELKQKLLVSLGQSSWSYTPVAGGTGTYEYRVQRKSGTPYSINLFMKKAENGYNVYLTGR